MLDGGIVPVLLSDGEGSRLRLISRETYPKQLLFVLGEKTPLRQSALQVADRWLFAEPILIANAERRFILGERLSEIGISQGTIVLEPLGRGDPFDGHRRAACREIESRRHPSRDAGWVGDHVVFQAAIGDGLAPARDNVRIRDIDHRV